MRISSVATMRTPLRARSAAVSNPCRVALWDDDRELVGGERCDGTGRETAFHKRLSVPTDGCEHVHGCTLLDRRAERTGAVERHDQLGSRMRGRPQLLKVREGIGERCGGEDRQVRGRLIGRCRQVGRCGLGRRTGWPRRLFLRGRRRGDEHTRQEREHDDGRAMATACHTDTSRAWSERTNMVISAFSLRDYHCLDVV